jgi:putative FmdB family regulatory protein
MPLYEYVCADCARKFEKLVRRWGDAVDCVHCGSGSVEKQLSTFAVGAVSAGEAAACGQGACGPEAGGCAAGPCGAGACGLPN